MRFIPIKPRVAMHGIMIVVAIACSLLIVRRDSVVNISPCSTVPGCIPVATDATGTFTTVNYGFPISYRETKIFRPTKNATYKETRLTQNGADTAAIILDVIFWYALFALVLHIRDFVRYKIRPRFVDDSNGSAERQSAK